MRQERMYIGIGFFVLGALLLTIVSAMFVYSEYLHGKVETYVMLFKGSLNGLSATSPVTYRGVKIGEVKRIELTATGTGSGSNVAIPVYIEFFIEKSFVQRNNPIQILINNGIVANVTSPNILTGTAGIELIQPKIKQAPLALSTFHGFARFPTANYPEEDMTIKDSLQALKRTLKDVSTFVHSTDMKETVLAIKTMANRVDNLALAMDKQVPGVKEAFQAIKTMAKSVDTLALALDRQAPGVMVNFSDSLKEISKAAYSTRNLTDYLARHPESLLKGRQ